MLAIKEFERMHSKIIKKKEEKDEKYGCLEEDYIFKQEIGKGAYGEVFKVKAKNGRTYILKKISLAQLTSK